MGWGSATAIFDGAVDAAMLFVPQNAIMQRSVVEAMYTKVDWDDWDTQDESKYYNSDLIHIMLGRHEIEVDDYDVHMSEVRAQKNSGTPSV